MKHPEERYRIAVDFDGVLHAYTSAWTADEIHRARPWNKR